MRRRRAMRKRGVGRSNIMTVGFMGEVLLDSWCCDERGEVVK